MEAVTIVGAGLAGCEAAWQLLRRGVPVRLCEMRPGKTTPAHRTGHWAELVCSNSLRAAAPENAVGLLKAEMRLLDSLVLQAADATAIPAGGALAVDRTRFSAYIEEKLRALPGLTVIEEEVTDIQAGLTILAAGPLASDGLTQAILALTGQDQLYFHDAIAPIVDGASVDMEKAFFASRYGKGDGTDYLNCPMNREEYLAFYHALVTAEVFPLRDFEKEKHFSGCMPLESMARYGEDAIRFGPLKPVGLELPGGGEAYAVLQLRKENAEGSMFNLVGCQTRLLQKEQRRVFGLIPGLEQAEFLRYGSMHRNTFLHAPLLLDPWQRLRTRPDLYFAGQITGVEGYVESAASGLMAGRCAAAQALGEPLPEFPAATAHGSLLRFLQSGGPGGFQPMNVNFGLFPPLKQRVRGKKEKAAALAQRALEDMQAFCHRNADAACGGEEDEG
ncbi:MAG: methylenetetrahydrofolate--tRNA-(uracil(54)-C(5))-methyltransferase (FADH(2)-oxidizing) TrmFO [Clostridiales bacterium]|nr:methylenetetrahydrofolate--tRNA-(uracil(54)-C(5))-methyltransferase (FADH(2)-oxidizing) TrmFO [Clostridiales bacterium]